MAERCIVRQCDREGANRRRGLCVDHWAEFRGETPEPEREKAYRTERAGRVPAEWKRYGG